MDNRKTVVIVLLAVLAIYIIPVLVLSGGVVPYVRESTSTEDEADSDNPSSGYSQADVSRTSEDARLMLNAYMKNKYGVAVSEEMIDGIEADGSGLADIRMRDGYNIYVRTDKKLIVDNLELNNFKRDFTEQYIKEYAVTENYRITALCVSSVVPVNFAQGSFFEGFGSTVRYKGDLKSFMRKYGRMLYYDIEIEWISSDGDGHYDENKAFLEAVAGLSPEMAENITSVVLIE